MSLSLLGPAGWLGYDLLMGILEAQECELKHARESWDWLWYTVTSVHMLLTKASHMANPKSHGQSQVTGLIQGTWPIPSHRANPRHMANPKANGKGVDAERSEEV